MARTKEWDDWNQGKMPLVGFNFMLRVELAYDLPCKSIKSFTRKLEYENIQEGGLNDYVHMRRKPISTPFEFEVERYVGVDYVDPLPLGADLVLPVLLFVSRAPNQFTPGSCARTYVFTGCTVTGKTYGALDGESSGLMVETTTIAYREMLCVDTPWNTLSEHTDEGEQRTPPTNIVTGQEVPENLRRQGQSLYEKAKAAKETAEENFSESEAKAVKTALSDALEQLNDCIKNGAIAKASAQASAMEKDPSGRTYRELAEELRGQLSRREKALLELTRQWRGIETQRGHAREKADLMMREIERREREEEAPQTDLRAEYEAMTQKSAEEIGEKVQELQKTVQTAAQTIPELQGALPKGLDQMDDAAQEQTVGEVLKTLKQTVERVGADAQDAAQKEAAATRAAAAARQAKERAEELAVAMKNNETNLAVWIDRAVQALKVCAEKFPVCEEKNSALQKTGKGSGGSSSPTQEQVDGQLQQVRALFEALKPPAQEVIAQEKFIRQTCQYLQAAQDLTAQAAQIPAGE